MSVLLEFAACEVMQCVNITIRDDGIPEAVEVFFVHLDRTRDLVGTISLDPMEAEIEIGDSNSMYIILYDAHIPRVPILQWLWLVWRR